LKNLHVKYSYLEIKKFEISENAQNGVLLETMSKELHFRASSLPVTIINDRYFIGFQDENTNGKQIEEAIIEAYQNGSEKTLKCVILDLSTSPSVDIAGAKLIKKLYLDLQARGISFKIAEAHAKVRDLLRLEDVEFLMGHISRKITVDDLVNESLAT